jgi:hypothetical protein
MAVSGLPMVGNIASMATNMQAENLGVQFSTAALKNTLDIQKQQGEALVAMINKTTSLTGTGSRIDISA